MGWDERDHVVGACMAYLSGDPDTRPEHCLSKVIDTFGWRWGFVLFSYSWLVFLWIVQGALIRLCCGKLKPVERARATATVLGKVWSSFLFVNVVLAPEDVREWLLWLLWFSSTGLLKMLETVGKEHFEHVVENPRFGVGHTLRTLGLHAAVLYLGAHLARLGWNEFFEWGGGPIGQILLSPSPAVVDGDVIELNGNDGYGYFGAAASTSTDPERGGTGFALLLLYDLAVTATEVGLSALKYTTNLLELHKDPDSAYTEEGSLEQTVFFTRLGQAILGASRTVYMFKSCGHCALVRKVCIRIMSTINGGQTFNRIHSAACRIVLAREMDVAFPDATGQELKTMAADESCAICLKTMTSAKKLECQHFFHAGCLRQYLNTTARTEPLCPICRAPISWNPTAGGNKPVNRGEGDHLVAAAAAAAAAARVAAGDAPNMNVGDDHHHHHHIPLAFGPAVNGPPTPDGFSRAARGADSVVRVVRQMLRFGLTGGGGGGGGVGGGRGGGGAGAGVAAAAGGGGGGGGGGGEGGGGGRGNGRRTREAASGREDSPPPPSSTAAGSTGRSAADHGGGGGAGGGGARRRAAGGGDGDGNRRRLEAVAQQLVEIFPSMGWGEALNAARLSNGSTTQAVEYALSNHSSSWNASPQGGQAAASRDGGLAVGASGQGVAGVEGNRAGRRWWE